MTLQVNCLKDPFGLDLFGVPVRGVQGKVVPGSNEAVAKPFSVCVVESFIHTRLFHGIKALRCEAVTLFPDRLLMKV